MILSKTYNGTFFSQLNIPEFKGLMQNSVGIRVFGKSAGTNIISFSVEPTLIYKEFNGEYSVEVLKSRSDYVLILDKTVTIDDLYEIVLEAFSHFISAKISEQDRETFLNNLPPPPLSTVIDVLNDIVSHYRK